MVAPGAVNWRRLLLRSRAVRASDPVLAGPWLVLAPHPDDESLGVGGLLAARALRGDASFVAFLTDGAGSHRDVPGWSPARVGRARRAEGRQALVALGIATAPLFLGWQDAAPAPADGPVFRRTVARLTAFCRRHRIGTIVTTWAGEPHCDHAAAASLARAVTDGSGILCLEYLVWGWTRTDLARHLAGRRTLTFDVTRGRARQRRAIACHRSQFGGRIAGGGERFRLPPAMTGLADRRRLILLSGGHRDAP